MKRPLRWLAAAVLATVTGLAALAADPTTPVQASTPIQHVVVLYLENQSFDHVLGDYCRTATMPDGVTPRCGPGDAFPGSVPLSNGVTVKPIFNSPDAQWGESHTVASQVAAIHGGAMNGWQNEQNGTCNAKITPAYRCISGETPAQVPNIASLVDRFGISDRFFEEADSPSWGGHMYAVAASLDGFTGDNPVSAPGVHRGRGWGCDSNLIAPTVANGMQPSCVPDRNLGLANGGAFRPTPMQNVPTIMDRLDSAGLSWRIYGATKTDRPGPGGGGYSGYIWSVCPTFAECLHTNQNSKLVDQSQFFTDAAAGNLPAFSLVTAGGQGIGVSDSCHNSFSITACDNYVGKVAAAVMNSPEWSSTALFITWDDFGGWYDSQPPPAATSDGIRVPLLIVSPYVKPNSTDSTPATFASLLHYTEETFGLAPLNTADAQAYDLSGSFNYSQPPLRPVHMITRPFRAVKVYPWMVNDPS